MANPARSLSNLLNWLRVLPALGIEVPTGILPATTTCPLCHGDKFQVVDDRVLGGSGVGAGAASSPETFSSWRPACGTSASRPPSSAWPNWISWPSGCRQKTSTVMSGIMCSTGSG